MIQAAHINRAKLATGITILSIKCLFDFTFVMHVGILSSCSLRVTTTELIISCMRKPGEVRENTFSWNWSFQVLKDKFKICKYKRSSNSSGIPPVRLLEERSKLSNAINLPIETGIKPESLFVAILKVSKLRQEPIVVEIFLESWLLEASRTSRRSKIPTRAGGEPLSLLCAKYFSIISGSLKISLGMLPLSLFCFRPFL